MPIKQTPEQLQARRQQIVHAAWACFARQGFHATSMDEVIAETGLSTGAVYRYFAGKEQLIAAAASEATEVAQGVFDELLAQTPPPTPGQVLGFVLDNVVRSGERDGVDRNRLAVQVWAETIRSPAVLRIAQESQGQLRAAFVALARRWTDAGQLPPGADPTEVGALLFAVVPGFILQTIVLGDVDPRSFAKALADLTRWQPSAVGSVVPSTRPPQA